MRALIISTNALGDTYLSAAAIPVLRDQLGISHIDVAAPLGAKMFLDRLDVDHSFYVRNHAWSELLKTLSTLRADLYEYVFSFIPGFTNSALLLGTRGNRKSGYLTFRPLKEWYDTSHEVYSNRQGDRGRWTPGMKYLDLVALPLKAVGIELSGLKKPVFRTRNEVQQMFNESVVIHPLSRSSAKSLSVSALKDFVSYVLNDLNREVVLLGGKSDASLLEMIALNEGRVKVSTNSSIDELLDMILSSYCFVGVDSFPLHIADAHTARFVGVFGPTNPASALDHSQRGVHYNVPNLQSISGRQLIEQLEHFLT